MAPVLVLKREVAVRRLWADVDEDSDDAMDECVLSPWFAMGKRSPACDSSSSTEVEGYTSEEKGCGSEETSETLRRFEGAPAVSSEVLPVGVPAQCPETDEAGASRSAGSAAHSGGKAGLASSSAPRRVAPRGSTAGSAMSLTSSTTLGGRAKAGGTSSASSTRRTSTGSPSSSPRRPSASETPVATRSRGCRGSPCESLSF
eukprot:CAMPEP_0176253020 /NCGR_PEP_ID=MMETSP0121_2-20121125/35803_1 /TAXON_ID=160619 /ORGANISM="Kryptoperidinium foliaceum, Strain CCMP 1326" /LENGTH=201 /DNA_ID=CAMNT_0017592789 /DNA_START=60 /DNA_END=663 /DNA_ORIENTATION=+